ncbi:hypothetical protein [Agaribacter marinus]|nr:hypothetical protein [Agaribacter marinus]
MDEPDRIEFHEYIFSRGGYIIPSVAKTKPAPIYQCPSSIPISFDDLVIFKEDIFPKSNFLDLEWFTPYQNGYFTHGPGMLYSPSWRDEKGLHRGRIYMGLFSTFSFLKPNEKRKDGVYEKFKDEEKKVLNFYQACCRNIRKNCRKDNTGFYHGVGSDLLSEIGVEKLQF